MFFIDQFYQSRSPVKDKELWGEELGSKSKGVLEGWDDFGIS